MTRFDVHVCLVSQQPTPNFIPVLAQAFRPQEVILVVTPSMKNKANALEKVMKKYQIKVQQLHIENEYDTADIGDRLFDLLVQTDKSQIALNTTGGTKLMSIGAYATFKNEGYPSFYVMERTGDIQILDSKEVISLPMPKISIEDYLNLHGYAILDKQLKRQIHQQWLPVAEKLVQAHHSLAKSLSTLNWAISQTAKQNLLVSLPSASIDQNMNYLISVLEKHDLATFKDNTLRFASEEARNYMAGTWFEEYVFQLVKSLPNVQDCAMGVQIDLADEQERGRNEVDIAVMYNNALHILECKTVHFESNNLTNAQRNEPLYKLETLKKLGGLKTRLSLISYRPLTKSMKKRADGAGIHVLQSGNLQGLRTELQNWLNSPK